MNLKKSPFTILKKERREIDYIKAAYKRKIQDEIESYKDSKADEERVTLQAQDIFMLVSIQSSCIPQLSKFNSKRFL